MYAQKRALPECVKTAPDDAEFVRRFQHGEKSVFNQLMICYQDAIYRLVYRYVENHEDALDVTQLTPMQRDTFMLRYYEGLSLKSIARKLKREIGTIKSHLFFARKRLQDELRPYLRGEANEAPENQVDSNFGRGSKIRVNRAFETIVE
jgi:DNA-directed RNA polymerase specialized sigma24 family protein